MKSPIGLLTLCIAAALALPAQASTPTGPTNIPQRSEIPVQPRIALCVGTYNGTALFANIVKNVGFCELQPKETLLSVIPAFSQSKLSGGFIFEQDESAFHSHGCNQLVKDAFQQLIEIQYGINGGTHTQQDPAVVIVLNL